MVFLMNLIFFILCGLCALCGKISSGKKRNEKKLRLCGHHGRRRGDPFLALEPGKAPQAGSPDSLGPVHDLGDRGADPPLCSPGKKFTSSPPAPRLPPCAGKSPRSRKKTFWPNRWGGIPPPASVWRPSRFIGKTPEASWSSSPPIIHRQHRAFYKRFAPPLTLPGNKTIWLRWGSFPPNPKRDTDISKKEDSSPKPADCRFCRRNPSARNRLSPKPRPISEPGNISGTAACSSGERMFSGKR